MSHRITSTELTAIQIGLDALEALTQDTWTVEVDEHRHKATGEYEMFLLFKTTTNRDLSVSGSESRGYTVDTEQQTTNYSLLSDAIISMCARVYNMKSSHLIGQGSDPESYS